MKTCVIQISALCLFAVFLCTACTLSFNNVCSVGEASDIVDTAQEPNNDIKPNLDLSIPVKPL